MAGVTLFALLRRRLDVVGEPALGQSQQDMLVGFKLDGHTKPSKRPSPVVAQLGTTYQILSFN